MSRCICIHGHFYQPSRENPWTGRIDLQDSAYPYHDWNERISAECYAPNAAARILDGEGWVLEFVNTYRQISFTAGPTLFSWLEREKPDLHAAIVSADRESQKRYSGHGSAIAQPYNHLIMPLASMRDRETQVIWGIRDFSNRFSRMPEGMWLPELAVDYPTLDIMAGHGILFSILHPPQAARVREIGEKEWSAAGNGGIDTTMPYLCRLPSGKAISIFFYDARISHEIAFGDLLQDGRRFASRLIAAFPPGSSTGLVHVATDGETYGHHRQFGEMALARCLADIASGGHARLTVYGEYLEKHPPTHEVGILENTSWSCVHGIARWSGGCTCSTGRYPGWSQDWRGGLREAADWLAGRLAGLYMKAGSAYLRDPASARDEYIDLVLDRSGPAVDRFLARHAVRGFSHEDRVAVLKLLEMQRHAMLMLTSCGWFFDDISEPGSVQVLRHAARCIQLAGELGGGDLEPGFLEILRRTPCNLLKYENAADLYRTEVRPAVMDLARIAAFAAAASHCSGCREPLQMPGFYICSEVCDTGEHAVGSLHIRSQATLEEGYYVFAVLHDDLGMPLVSILPCTDEASCRTLAGALAEDLRTCGRAGIEHFASRHSGSRRYAFDQFTRGEQRAIIDRMLGSRIGALESTVRAAYLSHGPFLPLVSDTGGECVLGAGLRLLLMQAAADRDILAALLKGMRHRPLEPEGFARGGALDGMIAEKLRSALEDRGNVPLLEELLQTFEALRELGMHPDLRKSQLLYHTFCRERSPAADDTAGGEWLKNLKRLGVYLRVRPP